MQFDEVEASPVGPPRRGDKGLDDPVHSVRVQCGGCVPVVAEGDGGRGHRLPGPFGRGQGPTPIDPGRGGRGLASRMAQLDPDRCVGIGADITQQPGEGRFLRVIPEAGIAGCDATGGLDPGGLDDDRRRPRNRQTAQMLPVPGLGYAVDGRILAHRGDDDPVGQR